MILRACQTGDMAVIRRLARLGVTASNLDILMNAAGCDHVDVVRGLVKELGADFNKARNDSATPLSLAPQNGQLDARCGTVLGQGARGRRRQSK